MEPVVLDDVLGRLRRVVRRAAGSYGLVRVVTDDAARGAVFDTLRESLAGVGETRFLPTGPEGAAALEATLREQRAPLAALVVPDADALVTFDEGRVLAALNLARDRLGTVVAGPLVLVLSPAGDGALARMAPDLREATLGVVRVETEPDTEAAVWLEEGISVAEAEAEYARILAADLPDAETVDALLGLGERFRAVVLTDGTSPFLSLLQRVAREAEARARRCAYVRGQANAMVLRACGDAVGAEALLREAIALLDGPGVQVDLIRARAALACRVADAGALDEGVRLFRDEVLPAVEQTRSPPEQLAVGALFYRLLFNHRRYREAAEFALREIVPLARAHHRPVSELHYLSIAASNYVFAGDYERGIALLLDEVLPLARRLHSDDALAHGHLALQRAYANRAGPGDGAKALLYADLARQGFLKLGDDKAAARMGAILRAHDRRARPNRAARRRSARLP